MTGNQPQRTNQGGNQSKGANYENPGGNSTGAMGTPSNDGGMSKIMNNGGGPEPHQGSNPGAQSDPGPKETGFYDQATNHVLGNDGIQARVERPSPMRMGGIEGSQPNAGQRGGQNTGTSGAQTSAYSSPEEYGAGPQSRGSMGVETRNPVGFASGISHDQRPMHEPGHSAYVDELGSEGHAYVYQSRAAQILVDMRNDPDSEYSRMDEPAEDAAPRVADKAGKVADAVKDKAGGFFSGAKDRVEGFLNVDLDNDGTVGGRAQAATGESYSGGSREMGYERDTPGTRPYDDSDRGSGLASGGGSNMGTSTAKPQGMGASTAKPQSFETREAKPRDMGASTAAPQDMGASTAKPQSFETREAVLCNRNGDPRAKNCGNDTSAPDAMKADSLSHAETQQRELASA